jgi:hypothetical protein
MHGLSEGAKSQTREKALPSNIHTLLRSIVDGGERWINLDDLILCLRSLSESPGDGDAVAAAAAAYAAATLATALEAYGADMDAQLRAGQVGRNRLQVVTDDADQPSE